MRSRSRSQRNGIDQSQSPRQVGGHQHAEGHRLAMQIGFIVSGRFDGVSERVAEVQNRPQTLLPLIAPDHGRLDLAGAGDGIGRAHPSRA